MNRDKQVAFDNQAEDDDDRYWSARERLESARMLAEDLEAPDLRVP